MKLSIVTINYNNVEGLKRTLTSVADQTYRDIEHVIVDAASTDGSVKIIKDYASKSKHAVIWSSEKDNGIYNGMNKGIRKATGDYIQILNSGDVLAAPDVTERMVSVLENEGQTGILTGNMLRDYGKGKVIRDKGVWKKGRKELRNERAREVDMTMDDFIKGTVNHDPTYVRADLYKEYELYDESLKIVSDWKWFVKAVVYGGEKVYYTPIDVTIFDTTGISETNLAAREAERRSELEKMLPAAILKDYDHYHFPISQYNRLKKYHLWGLVYFMERVLFKLEKWKLLRK